MFNGYKCWINPHLRRKFQLKNKAIAPSKGKILNQIVRNTFSPKESKEESPVFIVLYILSTQLLILNTKRTFGEINSKNSVRNRLGAYFKM